MKSIILLSGGLDSLVSMAVAMDETEIALTITFDYGQKSAKYEKKAAADISDYYSIPNKVIKLDWMKEITSTSLVDKKAKIPDFKEKDIERSEITLKSALNVWVPNRNAVFVNIAAAFAESLGADLIVAGFNSEEALTFPDNSIQFVSSANNLFKVSTLKKPRLVSYVQSFNKSGIVNVGIKHNAPFNLIYSCYRSSKDGKMCGTCESCVRLKRAFKSSGKHKLIEGKFA